MKSINFTHGKWHAWNGVACVLLSDESTKELTQHADVDACINYLFITAGDKPAARALNAHAKGQA